MRHLVKFVVAILLMSSAPVWAGEAAAPKVDDQTVRLSPVGLPIIVDGRVVNYVFATIVVDLTPGADVIALREKEPDFRDALIREAHRAPFVVPGDYNHLDEAKLKAVMLKDASAIAGPHLVRAIEVQNVQAQHFIPKAKPAPPVSN
jgi:hypothetical protein